MNDTNTLQDTIIAPATGQGGAVALIRLSGKAVTTLLAKCFRSSLPTSHAHATYGHIVEGEEVIDEVLVTYFQAPKSYTGEDTAEISCHASRYIVERIVALFVASGARLAEPGEFTLRSFLNGKRDLAEAEAVADLIHAEGEAQHRLAMAQLKGAYSEHLREVRSKLIEFASLIELELDFSEEDVTFADRDRLLSLAEGVRSMIQELIDSYQTGRKIRNGIATAIAGIPNAGKSALLNALLQENRAIVSDIEGTTRDTISETILIEGHPFRIIDTAGLRHSEDPIEQMGVARTMEAIEEADIVLLLIDAVRCDKPEHIAKQLAPIGSIKVPALCVLNKIDLLEAAAVEALTAKIKEKVPFPILPISAKEKRGLEPLRQQLLHTAKGDVAEPSHVVTNLRHVKLLKVAAHSLNATIEGLKKDMEGALLAIELRSAIEAIGEITGETISDNNLLEHIFANFCIGK